MQKVTFLLCGVLMLLILGSVFAKDEGKIPITSSSEKALEDFLKGRDLSEKLRAQESREYFEKAIAEDEDFALCYVYLAPTMPNNKGFFEIFDKAVALVDKVSEGEKLWILGFQAGVNALTMKQREYYQKLVQLYPKDERALNLLATHYFGVQDYEKAIEYYTRAIAINPDFSQPYNQLGYAYRFLKDYKNAEKTFKTYIKLIPDDPNPYDSHAELLLKMGKYEASIKTYKKALSINENFVNSYVGIATNLNLLGRYEEARKELQKLHDIAQNDGQHRLAYFATAVSYVEEGKSQDAIGVLKKQFELAEKINDAGAMAGDCITMGNILLEDGQTEKAEELYDKAFKLVEESGLSQAVKDNAKRILLFNKTRVAIAQNNIPDAKTKADEYRQQVEAIKNPFQIRLAHELVGRIAMLEKDFDTAIDELNLANLQDPYNLYRIAVAYKEKGDEKNSKEWFQQALQFNGLNNLNLAFIRSKAENKMES